MTLNVPSLSSVALGWMDLSAGWTITGWRGDPLKTLIEPSECLEHEIWQWQFFGPWFPELVWGKKILNKNGKPSDFMVISMASCGSLNWNPLMSLGCEVVPRPEKMMWLNYAARREAKGLSRGGTGWDHCWRQWGSGCPSGTKLCQLCCICA